MNSEMGALWRDVVNALGDDYPEPSVYREILELVANRHGRRGYFLQWIEKHLTVEPDKGELERDLRLARIAHDILRHHFDALLVWANKCDDGPFTKEQVETWWFQPPTCSELDIWQRQQLAGFLEQIKLPRDDAAFMRAQTKPAHMKAIFLHHLHKDLIWLDELDDLRRLARKTWPADPENRAGWTRSDLALVNEYFADQQPVLVSQSIGDQVDPFSLRAVQEEQSLGFGLDGLYYCMTVVMRAVVIDFASEVLEHARFPTVRGSLQCVECGRFSVRSPRGHGQLYCGERCKKRAAKRRYRGHRRLATSIEQVLPTASHPLVPVG